MAETSDSGRVHRRRKFNRIACLCLLIAGIVLAWQVYQYVESFPGPRTIDAEAHNAAMTATSGPAWPPSVPADLARGAEAPGGLSPLRGDPGGISPPAGARRTRAFQRRALGLIEQYGHYEFRGSVSAASGHYKRALAARGFTLLGGPPGRPAPGRQTLVFARGAMRVIVSLPKEREKGKMVLIRLTVITPSPAVRGP